MDISKYIRELIILNECVILRRFGGFDTTYKNASFDRDRKILRPPSKKINFRAEWIKDNGLLEKYIAETIDIPASEVSLIIDRYVDKLYRELGKKGLVFIEGLGTFSLTDKNRISFTELDGSNYLADSFGLDPLELNIEEKQGKTITAEQFVPLTPKKRKHTAWYVAAAIFLVFIALTSIILISDQKGHPIFGSRVQKGTEVIVFGNHESNLLRNSKQVDDSLDRLIDKALDEQTTLEKALAYQTPKKTVTNVGEGLQYYIVAGSFRTLRNAGIHQIHLERKGFRSEIMETKEGAVRVIIGKYDEKKTAVMELLRLRSQLSQSIWLLELETPN